MRVDSPFFIAIGPPKTGTTWLYATLQEHPDVFLPYDKEIRYFWARQFLGQVRLRDKLLGSHWHFREKRKILTRKLLRQVENVLKLRFRPTELAWYFRYFFHDNTDAWYQSLFDPDRLSGDITPKYCELDDVEIEHIKELNPGTKVIISMRDPVDREWSRAKMNLLQRKGMGDHTEIDPQLFLKEFGDPVQHATNDYVTLVERWKAHFSPENVFLFFYDELKEDPADLLRRVCRFLGIREITFRKPEQVANRGLQLRIPEKFEAQLFELNREYMERIPAYFDKRYPAEWLKRYTGK